MGKYTDEQNFLIMKAQYPDGDIDYDIGQPIVVDNITVGYVAEVIHKPSGEDTYILTDIKLPENPTPEQRAEVKEVTMLYQGSTHNKPHDILTDWLITDLDIAKHELYGEPVYDGNSYEYPHNPWASTKNQPIRQLDDMSATLNSSLDNYPNAGFRLYGHSLSCTGVQVIACRCKDPYRLIEINAYNGPNAYPLLTKAEKEQAKIISPITHIYIDKKDIVGRGYIRWDTISQVYLVNNQRIGIVGQHMGKAYIFDNFGNHLDPSGQLVRLYNGLSYLDINKDGINDLTIDKDGNLKDITVTLKDGTSTVISSFDLTAKYFSPLGNLVQIGFCIQLHPELLHSLVSYTIANIETLLEVMSAICALCIESNSEIGEKKEDREKTVYESIQEVFRGCNIPLIFENLNASIGKFKDCSDIFNTLSSPGTLLSPRLDNNEYIYRIGYYGMSISDYNAELTQLANAAILVADICNKEQCDDPSLIFPEYQSSVIKSWRVVENVQKELLESSKETFEGDGFRAGKNDAIQQSITDVLDVEESNIKELQNVVANLSSFMTSTALTFDDKDSSLGTAIESGADFSVEASASSVPVSYEAYLNRSEIFDDVKDVLQAFDMQVEKNSKDYAKKVSEIYGEALSSFEKGLGNWVDLSNDFKDMIVALQRSFEDPIETEKLHCSDTSYYWTYQIWGDLKYLYSFDVVNNVEAAATKVLPLIPVIEATIESSKTAKDKLNYIEPELRKIIEDGVYKSLDLMEVVQSQKVVLQLAADCKLQVEYVITAINQASMKGQAINSLLTKLSQIQKLFEYFTTFVSDCFGDNSGEEEVVATPQSRAKDFSLNAAKLGY